MSQANTNCALVTGATGFIGWHLVQRLKALGWEVHAIVREASKHGALRELLGEGKVHVHDGSVEGMVAIVERAKPRIVFHLASLFLSQHTTADVSRLVRSNVEFPSQLAEAMSVCRVPYLVNTGTSWQHFEDGEYSPVNLYAATKQACLDVLRYYVETGAFRVANLELFDTYGPNDARAKLFTVLRKAAQTGEPLAMSKGEQLIDLVYVDDVIEAFLAAASHMQKAAGAKLETFAVSSPRRLPLRELVELWQKVTGKKVNVQWGARPYRPREVMQPWNRGTPVPGWRPAVSLEEGIRAMENVR